MSIKFRRIVFLLILFGFSVFLSGCEDKKVDIKVPVEGCGRIISTAPSITETLFALGLGSNITGVTGNCHFPDGVEKKAKIGEVLDINMESVLMLKPDTVFVLSANQSLKNKLGSLKIKTVVIDQSTIDGFMASLDIIGKECLVEEKATELKKSISERMTPSKTAELKKVMIVAGRDYFSENIKDVYIAGNDRFYSELLKFAGAGNVYHGDLSYPKIQLEGIISMNPDIIVDVVTIGNECEKQKEMFLKSWSSLCDVNAVKNNRVFIVCKDYWSIPGPRFVNIIEELSEMVK
ncbi:MAG TPA: helical backbone metal receptor [bacterium]|nr:helical backbone metal receptor [bacterium]